MLKLCSFLLSTGIQWETRYVSDTSKAILINNMPLETPCCLDVTTHPATGEP